MTVLEQRPLVLTIPLREDPPGVLRVGKSRVLLDLVIYAQQQGNSPQAIVEMYDTLDISDVYAVIAYYLTHRADVDEYLRHREAEAEAIFIEIEATQRVGPTKADLVARQQAQAQAQAGTP